jgi:RNA polymerase sigma-70 factor (ECF subfamily)
MVRLLYGGASPAMNASPAQIAPEESDLIARIKAGETALYYDLIRPYQKSVYMAAFSILGNAADAEEIAQEAFLKALAKLDQFRSDSKFSTWLIQITINEARMRVRKDRKPLYDSLDEGSETEEGDYIPRDFADWRDIPSEALQRKELKQALARGLASLLPKYREVFVMRDIQHLSITETAQILGINEGTVKTRLLRARLQMRDALAPGFDASWTAGSAEYKKVRPW